MTPDQQLARFAELLLRWTARVNLIGPEARANLDDHIAEALTAAELLRPYGKVLDFGSGGGLPAIPMAIRSPESVFHLVEADQKKWSFLKFASRECGLNCRIWGDRLQAVVSRFPTWQQFDLVTSRAVGKPEEWFGLLAGHLAPGGRLALFQRSPHPPELRDMTLDASHALPRGTDNWLVVLRHVPRETS